MGSTGPQSFGADGPIVEVWVGVSDAFARNEQRHGHTVPAPVKVLFLVDTGASITILDPKLVSRLALIPRTGPQATTITAGITTTSPEYDISLKVLDVTSANGNDLTLLNLLVAELTLGGPLGERTMKG